MRGHHPVHPHACGADVRPGLFLSDEDSVHPHACGADFPVRLPVRPGGRFIPTRVGQMQAELYVGGAWVAVHPHACGADSGERLMDDITSSGSSPRVWGR